MQIIKKILLSLILFSTPLSIQAKLTPLVDPNVRSAEINNFIKKMVVEHHFNESELTQLLDQAEKKESILQAISKPAENVLPWFKYRDIFLSEKRIQEGVEFWRQNKKTLERAHKIYGVPPEIIVGIIGVETFYGKQKGSYRVLDALVTLGFDYPPRAPFFRSELEAFLLMTREESLDPTQLLGSYAGAMGMPQFISSSYRRYAVDFSGKGKKDLLNNTEDVIGSVANYFIECGWKPNAPVIFPVTNAGVNNYIATLDTHAKHPAPKYVLQDLYEQKVQLADAKNLHPKTRIAIIPLEEKQGVKYWLGLNNFYVITRYNNSNHYAMAVYELSQKIKSLQEKG